MDEKTIQAIEILKSIIQNPNTRIGFSKYSETIEINLWNIDEKAREQYLSFEINDLITRIRNELK